MLRIKEMRNKRKMSGPQLAAMLNITPTHLYDIEKERRRIHAEMLSKIADILGTSTDYLVGRTNDPSPPSPSTKDHNMKPNSNLITELVEETAKLPEDQQELVAGGWKWALDVVRRQETYKTKSEQPPRVTEEESKYPSTKEPPEDDIDVRSTAMAANLEDGESIPLTPKLENLIEDSIKESRKIRRERELQQEDEQSKPKANNEKATTDNQ